MPRKKVHPTAEQLIQLRRKVLRFYRRHGRRLPFRETTDPYKIAIAEIMLHQTQVERVLPYWTRWVEKWPDWVSLAGASARELLAMWSGLGYNRRAIYLGKLAQAIVAEHGGELPRDPQALMDLPGIGPYTSRAILIFAFNEPLVTIDTNIRKVILFELGLPARTPTAEIERLARQLLPKRASRDWHNALMDYSSLALPRRIAHLPPVSRQSRFEGSLRQLRGEIVRRLLAGERVTLESVRSTSNRAAADVRKAAESLAKEGIVTLRRSGLLRLA